METTHGSPTRVEDFPHDDYVMLPKQANAIPSDVRLSLSWMFHRQHDFCKYTPVNEIHSSLRNFEVVEKFGRKMRVSNLVIKDGKTLPIFQYMSKLSPCSFCWACDLCGLSLCQDPSVPACMPCKPNMEIKKVPEEWGHQDYLLYYLTKERPATCTMHPNQYRNLDWTGKGEDIFYKDALSHPTGIEILEYLHSKIDLGQTWEERKKTLVYRPKKI